MRTLIAACVAGTLVLTMTSCVSKTGTSAPTSTPPTSSTSSVSSPPETVAPDPAIAAELAQILASGDAERFNERICPATHDITPVPSIGAEYQNTQPAGIDTHYVPSYGDSTIARLAVRPGAELVIILGIDYNTSQWCAYGTGWCPQGSPGLAPFLSGASDTPALDEVTGIILCEHGSR